MKGLQAAALTRARRGGHRGLEEEDRRAQGDHRSNRIRSALISA